MTDVLKATRRHVEAPLGNKALGEFKLGGGTIGEELAKVFELLQATPFEERIERIARNYEGNAALPTEQELRIFDALTQPRA